MKVLAGPLVEDLGFGDTATLIRVLPMRKLNTRRTSNKSTIKGAKRAPQKRIRRNLNNFQKEQRKLADQQAEIMRRSAGQSTEMVIKNLKDFLELLKREVELEKSNLQGFNQKQMDAEKNLQKLEEMFANQTEKVIFFFDQRV